MTTRLLLTAAALMTVVAGPAVPAAGQEAGPVPTFTVTPATDLADGQVVTASGSGWSPHEGVGLSVCGADEAVCPVPTLWVEADGAGAFSTDVRIRVAYAADGGATDCRAEACSFVARQDSVEVGAAVSFAPDAPLVPPPVLTVSKADDLIYGEEIVVTGTGFFPHESVIVAQCFAGQSTLSVPWCGSIARTVDASGGFTETHRVDDRLYSPRSEHDCRGTPSSCPLTVGAATPPYRVRATATLGLRPEGEEAVTATPTTGLQTGQTVEVRATGLNANHEAAIGQCYVDEDGVEGACVDRIQPYAVGPDGTLTEDIVVRRTWHDEYYDRAVDCTVDHCHLLVAGDAVTLDVGPIDDVGGGTAVVIPLSFAGGATAATPTAMTPAFTG